MRRLDVPEPADLLDGEAELVSASRADLRAESGAAITAGGWEVQPVPRSAVLHGMGENWTPILRRQALAPSGDNVAIALTYTSASDVTP